MLTADMSAQTPLTRLLNQSLTGDRTAAEEAWGAVYPEVRAIAASALAGERPRGGGDADRHPTTLVNDVFLRLGRNPPVAWDSRRHFFGAVRQACEQQLVDDARTRNALKRGGGAAPIPLTFVARELASDSTVPHARGRGEFDLPGALAALAHEHPRAAEVARLRFVMGHAIEQIAEILGVSQSTIEKDLQFAKAWLRRWLDRE